MSFLTRIKRTLSEGRGHGQPVRVQSGDLRELVHHFESLDSTERAFHSIDDRSLSRQQALIIEVQAAFHNLGAEETLDIVMFTIAEIRKQEIKENR